MVEQLRVHVAVHAHAIHAAAAFEIWQVATPSRSRAGCALERAAPPDIRIVLPSSLDGQEAHHRAHMRLACGGAGQRWFFLALNWQGSSPLTQRKHSLAGAIEAVSPPPYVQTEACVLTGE